MTAAMSSPFADAVAVASAIARGTPGKCPVLAAEDAFLNGVDMTHFTPQVSLGHSEVGVILGMLQSGVQLRVCLTPDEAERWAPTCRSGPLCPTRRPPSPPPRRPTVTPSEAQARAAQAARDTDPWRGWRGALLGFAVVLVSVGASALTTYLESHP